MSNLQIIEVLCGILEETIRIVIDLSAQLDQLNALSDADRYTVNNIRGQFTKMLGADEAPDDILR